MGEWKWQRGDAIADDIAWLESVGTSRGGGWNPRAGAFADRTWVLHPIYENISERRNLNEAVAGDRVPWVEIWRRNGVTLGEGMLYPPSFTWLIGPGARTQRDGVFARETLIPPVEDTTDAETLDALLPLLPGGDGAVHAVWDILAAAQIRHEPIENDGYEVIGAHASLEEITKVTTLLGGGLHTPSNFWPEDRSWLVVTGIDMWATEVFGSSELIASLEAAPDLESLRWSPPG